MQIQPQQNPILQYPTFRMRPDKFLPQQKRARITVKEVDDFRIALKKYGIDSSKMEIKELLSLKQFDNEIKQATAGFKKSKKKVISQKHKDSFNTYG